MQFAIYAIQIDSSDLNTHLATLFILETHSTTKLDGMLTISKGYVKYVSRSALFSMNNMRNGPKNGPNNGSTKGPRIRLTISDL